MCGYFCIAFIDFMQKGNYWLDYANSFSPNNYEQSNKIFFLDSTKLKIVWTKITTFFKRRVSIIL